MKKIGRIVLLLLIIVAIGVTVLVAETEVFANQLVLSSKIFKPADGKYTVTYENVTAENQYLLLVVNGMWDDGTTLTLSDSNINYIDQAEATADGVSFENFIPRNIEDSTVFLAGAELEKPIVLGYIYGSGGVSVSGTVTYAGSSPATVTLTLTNLVDGKYVEDASHVYTAQTGTGGSFTVESVPAGTYNLKAAKGGHTSYSITELEVLTEPVLLSKSLTLYGGNLDGTSADGKSKITSLDISALLAYYGKEGDKVLNQYANIDEDINNKVTSLDLSILLANYNKEDIVLTFEQYTN